MTAAILTDARVRPSLTRTEGRDRLLPLYIPWPVKQPKCLVELLKCYIFGSVLFV